MNKLIIYYCSLIFICINCSRKSDLYKDLDLDLFSLDKRSDVSVNDTIDIEFYPSVKKNNFIESHIIIKINESIIYSTNLIKSDIYGLGHSGYCDSSSAYYFKDTIIRYTSANEYCLACESNFDCGIFFVAIDTLESCIEVPVFTNYNNFDIEFIYFRFSKINKNLVRVSLI